LVVTIYSGFKFHIVAREKPSVAVRGSSCPPSIVREFNIAEAIAFVEANFIAFIGY